MFVRSVEAEASVQQVEPASSSTAAAAAAAATTTMATLPVSTESSVVVVQGSLVQFKVFIQFCLTDIFLHTTEMVHAVLETIVFWVQHYNTGWRKKNVPNICMRYSAEWSK